jgi:hypothetical protein
MRISAAAPVLPVLVALVAPLAAAPAALAQATAPYPPPGYARSFQGAAPDDLPLGPPLEVDQDIDPSGGHRRAPGPHLRLLVGPNHTRFSRRAAGGSDGISATGAWISAAAGTAVHQRLVIFGELSVGTALDPRTSGDVGDVAASARALTSIAAGAGLGTFLDFWDLELVASLLLSQARLVDRDSGFLLARTRFGPTVQLGVARTWAASDHLGVGFQLRGHGARLAATDGRGAWWGLGLLAGLSLEIR